MAETNYKVTKVDKLRIKAAQEAGRKYDLPKYISYREKGDKYEARPSRQIERNTGAKAKVERFPGTDQGLIDAMFWVANKCVELGLMDMQEASAYIATYSPLMGKTPITSKAITQTFVLNATKQQIKRFQQFLSESEIDYAVQPNKN